MNSILTEKGEYLSLYFIGKNNLRWDLTGSETNGAHANTTIDTFINRKNGKIYTDTRSEIYAAAELGDIFI